MVAKHAHLLDIYYSPIKTDFRLLHQPHCQPKGHQLEEIWPSPLLIKLMNGLIC